MKLALVWLAMFRDGTLLHQFDDEGQMREHRFQEVLDRQDMLRTFCLLNRQTGTVYHVDLEHGRIRVSRPGSRVTEPEAEVEGDPSRRYRLIYFRRVTQRMTGDRYIECAEGSSTSNFLGFQYTAQDGGTVRRLLQITANDEVYLT